MPFDLDDDEYRATRILTGADKPDEIKVGEYVRTNKGEIGYIFQINNENKYSKYRAKIDTNSIRKSVYLKKEEIVKHSKNIIDLIEIGDYVNGLEVLDIYKPRDLWEPIELRVNDKYTNFIISDEIKSIVTKEMMASVEYRVETN